MNSRKTTPVAVLAAVVLAAGLSGGCVAKAGNAEPESRTFPFAGSTLNVKANDVPTDLVPADRKDVKVTRWFDDKSPWSDARWRLADGVLDIAASCSVIANCDAKFRVEVPRGVRVLRDGEPTDLRGTGE
ncbi:hypothetical protein BJF79_33575 [Actinomadura sp. CNU-125]|uniref:hypothetical protein n=1 Tax=Actinomadura sp. CNU-125 TaxID=1904961 RepID=UPI000966E98E|nr:hypothetical protein [Actinomadura sp. CNU-125]OLT34266.1 hypothetical protein BJF79_33575 [Actinomadura sp. CNU-125]